MQACGVASKSESTNALIRSVTRPMDHTESKLKPAGASGLVHMPLETMQCNGGCSAVNGIPTDQQFLVLRKVLFVPRPV